MGFEDNKNIVVSLIDGRLGNVLFQMANGYEYAVKTNSRFYIKLIDERWRPYYNTYTHLHLFPEYFGGFHDFIVLSEDRNNYVKLPLLKDRNIILHGWFESEFYTPDNLFCNEKLKPDNNIVDSIKTQYPNIENCVGISIRRGDYIGPQSNFLIPKIEWYEQTYHKYFNGCQAIIFSDDIEWCHEHMSTNNNFTFHYTDHSNEDLYLIENPMYNLYTMALCKHHICSDSTWSWWGAKLFEQKDAINVFQDKRYTDNSKESLYIPDRWIKERTDYEQFNDK